VIAATSEAAGRAPERDVLIDALKFLAIALVVLGHVLSQSRFRAVGDPVYYALAMFEMPLLAALSGFVLYGREGTSPGRFLRKKFLVLMVPYFVWAAIRMWLQRTPTSQWVHMLGGAALDPGSMDRLWYLYVLFLFYVLFVAVRLVSERDAALMVAAAIVMALFVLPGGDLFGRLNVQRLFPYFVGGYLWAKHRPRLSVPQKALAATVAGVTFLLLMWFDYNGPTQSPRWYTMPLREAIVTRPLPLVYFLGAASIYVLTASGVIWSWATFSLLPQRALRLLAEPGRSSMGIYVLHSWLLAYPIGFGVWGVTITWAFVVAGSWATALVIERIPVARGLLLGRWPSAATD
jgi:fucose 4-O-acetylase-like acetyltransferase